MTLEFIRFIAAGAFAGGLVSGLAGFGLSLFARGWLLRALPPEEAARVAQFLIPALLGIPLGLHLRLIGLIFLSGVGIILREILLT